MKNEFTIILPSKGRLREKSLNIFKKKKLKILSAKGERDLVGHVNLKKFKIGARILFLHARESIQALASGTGDICVSGIDLLKDSVDINLLDKSSLLSYQLYVKELEDQIEDQNLINLFLLG